MERTTLHVEGMSCGHCVNAIETSVGELNGVKKVNVNLGSGTVDIEFNAQEVNLDTIKETIDDQGYDVK